jgi:ABC-type transporter Mla subunit MlaD
MPRRLLLILVLAGAVLAGAVVWALAGRGAGATVAAVLREPNDVREGAAVLLAGVPIGAVHRVERSDSGTLLTIRLEPGDVSLRADDRVAVRRAPQGDASIEIVRAAGASRRWRPGDVLQPAVVAGP